MKNIQKNVESRIFRKRPLDIGELVDDCAKIGKTLDWAASFTLERKLKRTIDFWRNILPKRC